MESPNCYTVPKSREKDTEPLNSGQSGFKRSIERDEVPESAGRRTKRRME
jgi:hypothetical protein